MAEKVIRDWIADDQLLSDEDIRMVIDDCGSRGDKNLRLDYQKPAPGPPPRRVCAVQPNNKALIRSLRDAQRSKGKNSGSHFTKSQPVVAQVEVVERSKVEVSVVRQALLDSMVPGCLGWVHKVIIDIRGTVTIEEHALWREEMDKVAKLKDRASQPPKPVKGPRGRSNNPNFK